MTMKKTEKLTVLEPCWESKVKVEVELLPKRGPKISGTLQIDGSESRFRFWKPNTQELEIYEVPTCM